MTLVAEALGSGQEEYRKKIREGISLEEDLFAFIAPQLRRLKPHRDYLSPVLERALSPLALASSSPEGEELRVAHGAPHDAAKHVAAALVRRQNAVGDQECRCT